jgi:hypothetical protein
VLCRLSYLGVSVNELHIGPDCAAIYLPINHTRVGAGNGTRTRDPELGRLALYQLSYSRKTKNGGEGRIRTFEGIAGRFTVCSLWPLGNLSSSP